MVENNKDKPSKRFFDLVKKAQTYGIDIDAITEEIDRRIQNQTVNIARTVIDQIHLPATEIDYDKLSQYVLSTIESDVVVNNLAAKVAEKIGSQGVDIDALADKVRTDLQANTIDLDALAAKVIEKIPTGVNDFDEMKTQLLKELAVSVENIQTSTLNQLASVIDQAVTKTVEDKFMQYRDDIITGIRTEMDQRFAQITGNGGSAAAAGGKPDPLDKWMPVIEKLISGQEQKDPLSALDTIVELRQKLSVFDNPGPDPNLQYRSAQQILMEGIKIGSKTKTSGIPQTAFNSKTQTKIRPAIANM